MQSEPGAQIVIASLPNFRDLGGWATSDGRRVRRGLLFRSTDLDRLDAAGSEAVGRLRLRTVIDLRTADERQARPDRVPPGATEIVCDVLADDKDSAPAQLPKVMADPKHATDILGGDKATTLFERGYRDIVVLPSALAAYRRFFETVADGERRPLLFHCTTGKDRTGWAAAVTLTLLGVSEEDVMRDYMLTNNQLLPALQPVLDKFRAAGGDPDLLLPVLGVREAYLGAAFDAMRERFGSLERYLAHGLGVDASMQDRLREELTEEAG
jgi:protein-tyrosine phosphatase